MKLFDRIAKLWCRWRAYGRTYRELAQLDDRELADIRLTRSEIKLVARRAARDC